MCGPAGSGKSTWARQVFDANEYTRIVSRDEIRFFLVAEGEEYFSKETTVFKKYIATIRNTLVDGFDCVADATHLNDKSRRKLINALGTGYYNLVFVVLEVGRQLAIKQNASREGRRRIPDRILFWQFDQFTVPKKEDFENCKGVWIINGF